MSNPLFVQMNKNSMQSQFEQFKKQFTGNPREQVQQLLNSGRMSQQQFNQLQQMAQQIFGVKF